MKIFNRNFEVLEKAMDLRVQRQELISSNLANRETPGYIARDLVFENELALAVDSEKPGTLRTTNQNHFDGRDVRPITEVQGTLIHSFNPDPRKDGNTVDLDKENTKMVENNLMYDTLAQMTRHKFILLKTVLTEGGM